MGSLISMLSIFFTHMYIGLNRIAKLIRFNCPYDLEFACIGKHDRYWHFTKIDS